MPFKQHLVTISFDVCRFIFKCARLPKVPILLCSTKGQGLVQSTKARIGLASFQQRWKRHRAVVDTAAALPLPCILHLDCIELAYCYVLVMLDVTRLAWRSKKARLPTSSDIGLKFHSKRGTSRESGIMLTPPRRAASLFYANKKWISQNMFSL